MPMPANAEEAKDSHWQVRSFVSQLKTDHEFFSLALSHFQYVIVSTPHPSLPPIPNSLLSPFVEPCRVQTLGVARIQGLVGHMPPALTSKIMKFKSSKHQEHLTLGCHDLWRDVRVGKDRYYLFVTKSDLIIIAREIKLIKTDVEKTKNYK